jgi:hypothetical protein
MTDVEMTASFLQANHTCQQYVKVVMRNCWNLSGSAHTYVVSQGHEEIPDVL